MSLSSSAVGLASDQIPGESVLMLEMRTPPPPPPPPLWRRRVVHSSYMGAACCALSGKAFWLASTVASDTRGVGMVLIYDMAREQPSSEEGCSVLLHEDYLLRTGNSGPPHGAGAGLEQYLRRVGLLRHGFARRLYGSWDT